MGEIILFVATSLDGYIARLDGSVDWLWTDHDYGCKEFLSSISALVMGRKTYEQITSFGAWPYADKTCIVFSKSKIDDLNILSSQTPVETCRDLLKIHQRIWLVGGAQIVEVLRAADLINRAIIYIQPTILGKGMPLWTGTPEQTLKLISTKKYDSGMVCVEYGFPERMAKNT